MDNPNKKKADAKRVSQQPHEQAYQKRKKAATKKAPASRQKAK
ncbi:hypothetical protein ACX0G7_21205 [Flavitalea antarctica]